MKRFSFSLERVLEFRRQQEELERNRMEALAAQRLHLGQRAIEMEEQSRQARAGCAAGTGVPAIEIRQAFDYAQTLWWAREETLAQRESVERQRREQMQVVIEARRRVQLLEKLRSEQWSRHRKQADREAETLAGELHLAKLRREQTGSAAPPSPQAAKDL